MASAPCPPAFGPRWVLAVLTFLALVGPAGADTLELRDGRIVEGMVVEGEKEHLVLSRFGIARIDRAAVVRHNRARPLDEQIQEHLAALEPSDTPNRARFARWLQEIGRTGEARAVAEAILERDPEEALAHEILGHVRHQGRWMTPDEARRRQGLEEHGGQWYTPAEWANLESADRRRIEEEGRIQARQEEAQRISGWLSLLTSPDAVVRDRARQQLEQVAKKPEWKGLDAAIQKTDAYVKALGTMRQQLATAAQKGEGLGTVTSTFRVTLSRLKRPIGELATNLAAGPPGLGVGNAPVRIQLPELEVISVRTTGIIPVIVR